MAKLRLVEICKKFGKLNVLSNINLDIADGKFCVVLGPSGCGKSTLLNVIAGLEDADSGNVYLDEKDITNLAPRHRDFAFVFQNYALYPHLSAYDNMAFGLRLRGLEEKDIRVRIRTISQMLGIENKLDSFPKQLSGGQRQRVATGRAIVREPKLFLFDEPLSNLDARLRAELRTEFIKLHKQFKKTTVYVTHDQQEALALGDEIVILKDGSVEQIGTPEAIYHNPETLFVAEFIGTPRMNIIETKLTRFEKNLVLKNMDFKFVVPEEFSAKFEPYVDKKLYLGFRPGAARITESGQLVGEIMFIETIEESRFAHVSLTQDIEITIKIDDRLALSSEKLLRLNIEPNKLYIFNEAGRRVYL